jgi:hypothetical protein
MTSHDSADTLTPLRPECIDSLLASDFDRVLATELMESGAHAIEDVSGAARYDDEQVVMNDIAPVTTVGRRRGSK